MVLITLGEHSAYNYLIVYVTVGEHSVEVLDTFAGTAVVVVLQTFPDGPQIHRLFDDFVVVLATSIKKRLLAFVNTLPIHWQGP